MIICKKPIYPYDHLKEAGCSRRSVASGRMIQIIICKRPVDPDHHSREASPSEKYGLTRSLRPEYGKSGFENENRFLVREEEGGEVGGRGRGGKYQG